MFSQSSQRCASAIALAFALSFAPALHGCATVARSAGDDEAQNDPMESLNRNVFAFNLALDRAVIKPVAEGYRSVLPEFVRDRVRAVVDNLHEPLIFANDLLQGRGGAAGTSGRRFLINSTLGLAGLFDRATEFGLVRQSGDFGQTLYAWGLEDGAYLVLPFFGPSNFRDAVGLGVDMYASPIGHVGSPATRRELGLATGLADGIDLRSRNIEALDSLEESSLDFYAYLRSVSRQYRRAALREARVGMPEEELSDPGAKVREADGAKRGQITPPSP